MTYEILDTDTNNILYSYDSFEEAKEALVSVVREDPISGDELAIVPIGDDGYPADFIMGKELIDKQ